MKYNHNKNLVSNAKELRKNRLKRNGIYGMTIYDIKTLDLFVKKS